MALTNKPRKSKYQVGETAYILNGKNISSGLITRIVSSITNPVNDSSGVQENLYYIEGFSQAFKEEEVFHSKNAVLFYVKGDYLNKWGTIDQIFLSSSDILSNCDFSYSLIGSENSSATLNGVYLEYCILDGSNLTNVEFTGADLFEVSFRFAILVATNFVEANISSSDFRGANLSHAILPSSANTKSTFKSVVGAGHWDPDTTIWTDGLPIGN